jgi:multimeric flavodoxin WrbA
MRVLGIGASPRKGNSEALLDEALSVPSIAGEKINLRKPTLNPCLSCGRCEREPGCVFKDEISAIYDRLYDFDGIIFSSPIYFGSLAAQAKVFIDRAQFAWAGRHLLPRPRGGKAVLLVVAGMRKRPDFFRNAEEIFKIWCICLGLEYRGGIYFPGVDAVGDLTADQRRRAREAVRLLCQGQGGSPPSSVEIGEQRNSS